jgi:putative inorganic carbon (HCO3(-)) transporter
LTINAKLGWIYGVSIAFILLNAWLTYVGFLWLSLLPVLLLIPLLALLSPRTLVLFSVFMVPLSIFIKDVGFGLGMNLPSEPVMFGLMCLIIFKLFLSGNVSMKAIKHPITMLVLIDLGWTLITVFTSTLPFISIKFFIARLWFVTVFYFFPAGNVPGKEKHYEVPLAVQHTPCHSYHLHPGDALPGRVQPACFLFCDAPLFH